ncbi:MAG: aldo/keto reductase [Nocardioidaceae bacterium]|nr:MAG: aldo/keto reductase [Nocardioidaceae bacterium]
MTEMTYRNVGDSGLRISVVGLGCNAFGARIDQAGTHEVISAALDHGITFFDTADMYGSGKGEEFLGRALGERRQDIVLASKFGMPTHGVNGPAWQALGSRSYLRRAVEGSLRRLGTDWIDLYQFHQPDPLTPIEETLTTLETLVEEGKIRYYGCSNFFSWQLADAMHVARALGLSGFVSTQNEYSLYNRAAEAELVPACEHFGVGLLPYFPLAYGLLTGKYARDKDAPAGSRLAGSNETQRLQSAEFDRVEALQDFADKAGVSLLDVAIGGLAAQPAVASVIAGASRPEQIAANVAAGLWVPTEEQLAELNEINTTPVPGRSYAGYQR